MTEFLRDRRPDDVSPEEEKRLLALFDECLLAEKGQKSADELAELFQAALLESKLDQASRTLLVNAFEVARAGAFGDSDCLSFVLTLQKEAKNDLNDDELLSLRRLAFIFALAVKDSKLGRLECEFNDPVKELSLLKTFVRSLRCEASPESFDDVCQYRSYGAVDSLGARVNDDELRSFYESEASFLESPNMEESPVDLPYDAVESGSSRESEASPLESRDAEESPVDLPYAAVESGSSRESEASPLESRDAEESPVDLPYAAVESGSSHGSEASPLDSLNTKELPVESSYKYRAIVQSVCNNEYERNYLEIEKLLTETGKSQSGKHRPVVASALLFDTIPKRVIEKIFGGVKSVVTFMGRLFKTKRSKLAIEHDAVERRRAGKVYPAPLASQKTKLHDSKVSSDQDPKKGELSCADFRKQVLWELLGAERPQTAEEFMRVLHAKGIVLRHSS